MGSRCCEWEPTILNTWPGTSSALHARWERSCALCVATLCETPWLTWLQNSPRPLNQAAAAPHHQPGADRAG